MLIPDTWLFVLNKTHFSKQEVKHDKNIFLHKTIATNCPYQKGLIELRLHTCRDMGFSELF
jgi:hypothetical protein